MPLTAAIEAATAPSPWRVGNAVLYDLCRTHPYHKNHADVIAKMWLIGRSYAAAIERRKNKTSENDEFYVDEVAPALSRSSLDVWLRKARKHSGPSDKSIATLVAVHHDTTQLLRSITKLEKRSLASKYLHFHVPSLFYIYDARAVKALATFRKITGPGRTVVGYGDRYYGPFSEKCLALQNHIAEVYDKTLTPRELDNFLLYATKGPMKPRSKRSTR